MGEKFGTSVNQKPIPPSFLNLPKNISHSSGEVDSKSIPCDSSSQVCILFLHQKPTRTKTIIILRFFSQSNTLLTGGKARSTSEQDLLSSISLSQSESALRSMKSGAASATSPVTSTTKEILSPFSKFAKGMQNLGANLDPRKLKSGGQGSPSGIPRNLSDHQLEERQKLLEKWSNCRSKLIVL